MQEIAVMLVVALVTSLHVLALMVFGLLLWEIKTTLHDILTKE